MSKAKSQNQSSFRICYHRFLEALIKSTLQTEITTFVNMKVRQMTDLTHPLSAPFVLTPKLTRPYLPGDILVIQQEAMDIISLS